jgi:ABC-2 type transport system permease protein
VLPLFLLLLFGYALTLDVDRIPTVVCDNDQTPQSRELLERLRGSRYFSIVAATSDYGEIEHLVDKGTCLMGVVVRRGYGRSVLAGRDAQVQLLLDGSDSNTASIALGYATALLAVFDSDIRRTAAEFKGAPAKPAPVDGVLHVWYNPELRARNYIVPGLIALIMMIIGALITSLTIAREYETGTMEQLLSTPVRPVELVLGKMVPYFVIGMADVAISVAVGILVLGVPMRGMPLALAGSAALFMLGCLSMGLFISAATRSQTLAFQLGILTSFLPAFLLSGFIYSIENMPVVVQLVTRVVPARYFIALLKGIFLKGIGPQILWVEGAALAVFAVVMFRLAVGNVKGKLV